MPHWPKITLAKYTHYTYTCICGINNRAYLAIVVEVRVESNPLLPSGHEVHQHGHLGIVRRKEHIKLKTAIGIWRLRGTSDKDLAGGKVEVIA